jgi:hypothetical protein
MEHSDKMKLQERAANGREAEFLLTEKFSGEWLARVETDVLSRLNRAAHIDELVKIQADYRAALRFRADLLSVSRKGREALKKLHEEQVKE